VSAGEFLPDSLGMWYPIPSRDKSHDARLLVTRPGEVSVLDRMIQTKDLNLFLRSFLSHNGSGVIMILLDYWYTLVLPGGVNRRRLTVGRGESGGGSGFVHVRLSARVPPEGRVRVRRDHERVEGEGIECDR
jgi:hypothetical protein